jgi:tetratricopeptide (TPR) repeat protein
MGRIAESEVMARRGVVSQPKSSIAYWNLSEVQIAQHRFEAADSTLALLKANLPENPYRYFVGVTIAWGRRDYDALESYLDSEEGTRMPNGDAHRCALDLQRGRIRAWQGCQSHHPMVYRNPMAQMAEFRMTGDTARARLGYEAFLAQTPDDRDPDLYSRTIAVLADVGRIREAKGMLEEWRRRAGPTDPGYRSDSSQAVGAVAAAEGEWDRAVSAFLAWNTTPVASAMVLYNRGLPEAAAILARRGQADSAIVLFERAMATSSAFGGNIYETGWYAQALLMLGELYEARGDRVKAAEYYRRHIAVFKDPDPPIARQVAAVREKLARVTGEPGAPNKR